MLLSSCVGSLADGGAWRDCVDLVAVLGFGTIALNQMTSLVRQVAQASQHQPVVCIRFVPVFAGVALLAGQTAGAAVYSTMFYAMAAFLAEVLQNLLAAAAQIYFCFSVSAALWGDSGIADAANLFARCFTFALKLCGMLFTFVLGFAKCVGRRD
ncbi:MAG: stage III sporulation protein AE [Subdoligranulum sp.]